jgi:DNA-binding MarR family transcriptional regulator
MQSDNFQYNEMNVQGGSGGEPPKILWSRSIGTKGGDGIETGNALVRTNDGGFVIAGGSSGNEMLLVKTDANGEIVWNQTFNELMDTGNALIQTGDGGFVIAGSTQLVKSDSTGKLQWNHMHREGYGHINDLIQTSDDGFAIASYEFRLDGSLDKTDSTGELQWKQEFSLHILNSIVLTNDGGFAIAGLYFGDAGIDMWLQKTDSNGNQLWNRTFGGLDSDSANSLIQTNDGGYVLAGNTQSFGTGGSDMWLIKTDSNGNQLWNQTFGGTEFDTAYSVIQANDGGFILAGQTRQTEFGQPEADERLATLLVKTDSNGIQEWNQTFEGLVSEYSDGLIQTPDGEIVFTGSTGLQAAEDNEIWLVKLSSIDHREGVLDINVESKYIIVGTALTTFILGIGFYFVNSQNIKNIAALLPNDVTKTTLEMIFNGNIGKYLSLIAGIQKIPEETDFQSQYLRNILQYKFLLHPARLALAKILVENPYYTSRELKTLLDLTWGELNHHLTSMQKHGLVEIEDRFLDGITRQTILVTELGISHYNSLIKNLKEFINSDDFNSFEFSEVDDKPI